METQPIRFFHRGQVRTVTDTPVTRTVLQYLCEDAHCTSAEEGYAEGDCGTCTIVLGELREDGSVGLKVASACIQFLPTLGGKALFTVEDVRGKDDMLHPVQETTVECHGFQCGFCTPDFVMSLCALYGDTDNQAPIPSRQTICDSLAGNLCCCTGYRPIIDTGKRMFELPSPTGIDRTQLTSTLRKLQHKDTFSYAPVGTENAPRFYVPRTAPASASIKAAHPDVRILAGSTDVGLWVTKQLRDLGDALYIGRVAGLYALEKHDGQIEIDAAVSFEEMYAFLAVDYPEMTELWKRFTSLSIRNTGTLSGNVANDSPIGDSAPALIAIGTRIAPQHGEVYRELPLEDLYLAYQKDAVEEGEFAADLHIPARKGRDALHFRAYRLSKRFDEGISAVCAALAIKLNGNIVHSARIAYGSMAATSKRTTEAENAILSQPWDEATMRAAVATMSRDYTPLTGVHATDNCRCVSATNMVYHFQLETHIDAPLAPERVNVRAVELDTLTTA